MMMWAMLMNGEGVASGNKERVAMPSTITRLREINEGEGSGEMRKFDYFPRNLST